MMTAPRAPLTLVVLTFNEERNLAACLETVAGLAAATVVVDSGSTDRTTAIADEYGARVLHHPFETHDGIEILRARGTRFSKQRFIGRASNYVTYFLSACYAGFRLDRPDVVVALTDPPIIGLAAWLSGKRFGAPLVMRRH